MSTKTYVARWSKEGHRNYDLSYDQIKDMNNRSPRSKGELGWKGNTYTEKEWVDYKDLNDMSQRWQGIDHSIKDKIKPLVF